MKRNIKIALAGVGLILAPFVAYELFLWTAWDFSPHYSEGDRCLDSGGCWDKVDNVCRKDEPDAQALCDRSKSNK